MKPASFLPPAFLLLFTFFSTAPAQTTAKEYFDKAQAEFDKNNKAGALADIEAGLKLDSGNAWGHFMRGYLLMDFKRDYDQCIAECTAAIKLNPKMAAAYDARGLAYSAKGRHAEAIKDITEAIHNKPESSIYFYDRGSAYAASGNHASAIDDFTTAIKTKPIYDYYFQRGKSHEARGEHSDAIADYAAAIKMEPNLPATYYYMAMSYQSMGDYDSALANYATALGLAPNYFNAIYGRASCYQAKEDFDNAIADCNALLKLNPKAAAAYDLRARTYLFKDNYDAALADCNTALKLTPNGQVFYWNRGLTYYAQANHGAALSDFRKCLELYSASGGKPNEGTLALRIMIWCSQAEQGAPMATATQELAAELGQQPVENSRTWMQCAANYLLGELIDDDLFDLAKKVSNNPQATPGQTCEALYYAGIKHWANGDKTGARSFFEKCVATGVAGNVAYHCAKYRLAPAAAEPAAATPAM